MGKNHAGILRANERKKSMNTLRVALYCLLGGLSLAPMALGNHQWGWTWLAGIVLAAGFVPTALFGPRGAVRQFAVIAPVLLIVTVLCLWSEAVIFVQVPEMQQHAVGILAGSAVIYLVAGLVLAALAAILKLPHADVVAPRMHSGIRTVYAVLGSAVTYVIFYLVFGWLVFHFLTHGYYPDATQQVAKLGNWFWLIQFGRGILMTLAILPFIYSLRMPRWQAALAAGSLLWIAGGLAPLLLPNELMGSALRFMHAGEILTQNFPLGVAAVLLLRKPDATRPRPG
jgi:hypothetical protein